MIKIKIFVFKSSAEKSWYKECRRIYTIKWAVLLFGSEKRKIKKIGCSKKWLTKNNKECMIGNKVCLEIKIVWMKSIFHKNQSIVLLKEFKMKK